MPAIWIQRVAPSEEPVYQLRRRCLGRPSSPTEERATIGDGHFSDNVKAIASVTTDSFADEGFAKTIERFILGYAT